MRSLSPGGAVGPIVSSACAVLVTVLAATVLAVLHPSALPVAASASDRQELLVAAASSLSVAADDLELAFESTHPDIDVVFNFGGSSSLREQVFDGLPADVLVTANTDVMAQVEAAGLVVGEVPVVATNRLVVAVRAGTERPQSASELFGSPELLVGLCVATVPCGRAGDDFLGQIGVSVRPATREPDVRSLVTKLEAGELDAGLIYATDVAAADQALEVVDWSGAPSPEVEYPAAVLANGANRPGARSFVEFLRSASGTSVLDRHGFGVR